MDYFIIRGKKRGKGCTFEDHNNIKALIKDKKLLTPVCAHCGEQHLFDVAEFDSVEIKEAIRIIDYNRDKLLGIIDRLAKSANLDNSKAAEFKSIQSKIWHEMNEAVKVICVQNDLYQNYKSKK